MARARESSRASSGTHKEDLFGQEMAERVYGYASDMAARSYQQVVAYVDDNPRQSVLIALGVGVAVGAAIFGASRRGSLLSTLLMAVGGAAVDSFRDAA